MAGGESWRLFVRTLAADVRIAVGQQTAVRDEIAADSAFRTVMPFIVLVPVLLLVLAILIRRMFQPLTHLAADLDHRPEQDLGSVSAVGLPTEIRPSWWQSIDCLHGWPNRSASSADSWPTPRMNCARR